KIILLPPLWIAESPDDRRSGWPPFIVFCVGLALLGGPARASTGSAGASFLDIPVGAGPAALAGSYSVRAANAYAPVWNPAGLGWLNGIEAAAQHLSYLASAHEEFLSVAYPLSDGRAMGTSFQYLGSGDIAGADSAGAGDGDFSAYYLAWNMSYGQRITDKLSLGATGKWIHAGLDGVGADAFAMDAGALYRLSSPLSLAATVTNVGTHLTFLNDGDPLPLALHMSALYQPVAWANGSLEIVYRRNGPTSVHMGGEWQILPPVVWRVGYRTDTLSDLSPLAGFTTGIGLRWRGQEFSYAWAPLGELGNAQYFSFVARFGGAIESQKHDLLHYEHVRKPAPSASPEPYSTDADELYRLLEEGKTPAASAGSH
ncbi:MAG TPA: PorV/PorQ family protein, partial [Elusimicrobiota bacterium]|nr:PorV/PorQ family protein [Elusimicrobiota bacterium]